jgi:hypothetical protein
MWSEAGKPTYEVRAWRERGWWMARIIGASDGADCAPVDAVAHARTVTAVEQATRDVVTMILNVTDDAFDLELEFVLPPVIETMVCEAIGARTWLEAARELWREHSTVAIRALTAQGLTMRETAILLGMRELDVDLYSEAT